MKCSGPWVQRMQNLPFFVLDLAASFMLAAAASCRARSTGAHFSGAAVLACLAGMAAPLARDGLLGYGAITLNQGEYLAASVCGGIAEYFNIDPSLVRLAAAILFFAGGLSLWVYVIAAIILPKKSDIYPGY